MINIPDVNIQTFSGKYVVIEVSNDTESKLILQTDLCRGRPHREIVATFDGIYGPNGMCKPSRFSHRRVIGGGSIEVCIPAKRIRIYDSSGSYGAEPDRNRTVQMLIAALPDFEVVSGRER